MFRSMTEKVTSWASSFQNTLTRSYQKTLGSEKSSKNQTKDSVEGGPQYIANLPQIPKATMTGAHSLLGRIRYSNADTKAAANADDPNITLMSIDQDYHGHLRAGNAGLRP